MLVDYFSLSNVGLIKRGSIPKISCATNTGRSQKTVDKKINIMVQPPSFFILN